MPKRSIDASNGGAPIPRPQKKTERSHEENQERAYIAALRRTDRSIEARVQSARMASEIHKKRTGKGFKVSEEIVMREEMYEEEDDDLPRHFRALTAHLQTSSPELNSRVNAYLTNQVALATLARAKEVDRMFAQHFPGASAVNHQLQQSVYYQGLQGNNAAVPSSPYNGRSATPVSLSHARERSTSTARPTPSARHDSGDSNISYVHSPGNFDNASPPTLSPGPGSSIDSSTSTPQFTFSHHNGNLAPPPLFQSSSELSVHQSSFTSELSQEAKLFGGFDPNDPMTSQFLGGRGGFDMEQTQFDCSNDAAYVTQGSQQQQQTGPCSSMDYFQSLQPTSKLLHLPGQNSRIGTPGGGEGDPWNFWVNDEGYPFDEQHNA